MKNGLLKILALFGIGYFVVDRLVPQLVEDFANGIGVTFRKVRIKWAGVLDPTSFNFHFEVDLRNSNPVGGTVTGFNGKLTLGKKDGYNLGNLSIQPFTLPANDVAEVELILKVNLLNAGPEIIKAIQNKDVFRKLWVSGTLKTNFGPVPIDQEVSIFYE